MPADVNSILVGLAVLGDADLSGDISAADYFLIDRGKALRTTGWYFGDFDYSGGPPTGDDYMLIDRGFLDQWAGGAAAGLSAPARAVPEPSLLAPLALAILTLRRRRRVTARRAPNAAWDPARPPRCWGSARPASARP